MKDRVDQGDRDIPGAERDMAGATRDVQGVKRDIPGATRDVTGAKRDVTGATRDQGVTRDIPGAERDVTGVKRDVAVPGEDGATLRWVMRHVPSPVSVVTASNGKDQMRGITIGSFTSASLRPPLLSFNISRDAGIYDLLTRADRFALHVLHEGQAHLSDRFAIPDMPGAEQFRAIEYEVDAHGVPVLAETMVVFLCLRHAVYDAGDHSIVLGRVTDIREAGEDRRPLVYFDRSYRRVGTAAQPASFDPVRPVRY